MENEYNKNKSATRISNGNSNTAKGVKARSGGKASAMFVSFVILFSVLAVSLAIIANLDKINGPIGIRPGTDDGGGSMIGSSKDSSMKKFTSSDELKKFLDENVSNNAYGMMYGSSGMGIGGGIMRKETLDVTNTGSAVPSWGEANVPMNLPSADVGDHSATNVQVAGVDEADIVKTDGEYIYTITNNTVSIISAYPAEKAEIVSKIELDSAPQSMYLNGDRLAVYGQKWDFQNEKTLNDLLMPIGRTSFTYLKIYDISDRKNPKEIRNLYFEGSNANSRMIGDYIYLVTSSYPYYGYMRQSSGEDIVTPLFIENGVIQNNGGKDIACKGCQNVYYFDIPYNSYTYTTVSSININDAAEKVKSDVFLLDQSQNNIYVSENNIYITYTKYIDETTLTLDITMGMIKEYMYPVLSAKDREMAEEIENTKNYILSPQEKFTKIGMILQKYQKEFQGREDEMQQELQKRIKQKYADISKELEKTVIHKISIDKGDLKYKTSGEVTGMVLNQFSMDESGGYFRIATTKNRTWSQFTTDSMESYSNIYVLDGDMKIAGKVENIAKGEQIYSVRFMQNRAYMVTAKQTDPLFVIDLSSPGDPKILGELKVPGFSSYLHPYDDTTLIGLGKETDENGRVTGGVKLSLFDVSDVKNPRELDKYIIGDSSSNSIALNEHKAFLFSRDKNILVIPVSMQDATPFMENQGISFDQQEKIIMPRPVPPILPMPPASTKYFNGAYVFSIDKFRFNLKGQINHADSADNTWWNYGVGVQRSLYIKDMLYTLSNKYLKANKIEDLGEVKSIELPGYSNNNPIPMIK